MIGPGTQESLMKLLRIAALTAALITAAVPSLTTPANAWDWDWRGGWGWGPAAEAVAAGAIVYPYYGYGYGYPGYGYGYAPAYGEGSYGYGYPSYGYDFETDYYGGYRYGYHPVIRHADGRRSPKNKAPVTVRAAPPRPVVPISPSEFGTTPR
jgi:hypothetical protein